MEYTLYQPSSISLLTSVQDSLYVMGTALLNSDGTSLTKLRRSLIALSASSVINELNKDCLCKACWDAPKNNFTCQRCERSFKSTNKGTEYCKQADGEVPPVPRDCEWCHTTFLTRHKDQKYCGCPRPSFAETCTVCDATFTTVVEDHPDRCTDCDANFILGQSKKKYFKVSGIPYESVAKSLAKSSYNLPVTEAQDESLVGNYRVVFLESNDNQGDIEYDIHRTAQGAAKFTIVESLADGGNDETQARPALLGSYQIHDKESLTAWGKAAEYHFIRNGHEDDNNDDEVNDFLLYGCGPDFVDGKGIPWWKRRFRINMYGTSIDLLKVRRRLPLYFSRRQTSRD